MQYPSAGAFKQRKIARGNQQIDPEPSEVIGLIQIQYSPHPISSLKFDKQELAFLRSVHQRFMRKNSGGFHVAR